MIEPTELLEDFSVQGVVFDDTFVGIFRTAVIALLFIDMSDLEPDVSVG